MSYFIRLASPRNQAPERIKAEILFYGDGEGGEEGEEAGRARKQGYGHLKRLKKLRDKWRNRGTKERGCIKGRLSQQPALFQLTRIHLFLLTSNLLLNPTLHYWLVPNTHFKSFVIVHVWSLTAASTEREMKPSTEYLYSRRKTKSLCQVFQPSVDRKLNQNLGEWIFCQVLDFSIPCFQAKWDNR